MKRKTHKYTLSALLFEFLNIRTYKPCDKNGQYGCVYVKITKCLNFMIIVKKTYLSLSS